MKIQLSRQFLLALISAAFLSGYAPQKQNSSLVSVPQRKPDSLSRFLKSPVFPQQDVTDHILLRFKPDVSELTIGIASTGYKITEARKLSGTGIFRWKVPDGQTMEEAIELLKRNPDIEEVEPDLKTHIHALPTDPLFRYQYALFNFSQEIGGPGSARGFIGSDIKALQGWRETRGSSNVVIAVIDTGVDLTHPDLQNNVLRSGWDFVNNDSDPTDDNGHGTNICSIIAADTNNFEGIAGETWNCRILPIKGMDAVGDGYASWAIEAIRWAADQGVDIINLSIGAHGPSKFLEEALLYASDKDIVIVSSAGNYDSDVAYPAAYSTCMAVAATDYYDRKAPYSNHGPEIDVAAPGSRILCCFPTWQFSPGISPYDFNTGSSLSCAFVSGLAGLIKSLKPWLHAEEIKDIIRFSADDVNQNEHPGRDEELGYGRINLAKALAPVKISR